MTIVHSVTKRQIATLFAAVCAGFFSSPTAGRAQAIKPALIAGRAQAIKPAFIAGRAQAIKPAHGAAIDGRRYAIPSPGAKATVLIFVQHDCPICNGYAPTIQRLAASYAKLGAAFDLVYAEPEFTTAQAVKHARDYGYRFPCILSGWRTLVKETGATIAPEAVVLDSSGRIAYRGRIDNRFASLGVQRSAITDHDLQNAITQVIAGKSVTPSITQSVGCYITP